MKKCTNCERRRVGEEAICGYCGESFKEEAASGETFCFGKGVKRRFIVLTVLQTMMIVLSTIAIIFGILYMLVDWSRIFNGNFDFDFLLSLRGSGAVFGYTYACVGILMLSLSIVEFVMLIKVGRKRQLNRDWITSKILRIFAIIIFVLTISAVLIVLGYIIGTNNYLINVELRRKFMAIELLTVIFLCVAFVNLHITILQKKSFEK